MEIKFNMVDEKHIDIMCGEKIIGRIFTPGGTGEVYSDSIQICGFEQAYDYWGCGLFAEEYIEKIPLEEKSIEKMKEMLEIDSIKNDEYLSKHFKKELDDGYREEKRIRFKKDIHLQFKEYDNVPGAFSKYHHTCAACFNTPCTCENKDKESLIPYNLQRRGPIAEAKKSDELSNAILK